jgi:hypothetical protein
VIGDEEHTMAEQQPPKAADTRDAATRKTPAAPIEGPVVDGGTELTDDQLEKASGGMGSEGSADQPDQTSGGMGRSGSQLKKSLLGNFPR